MDLLRCCLFTTLALVLLTHTVLSAPMLDDQEMDDDVALSRIVRAALEAASEGDVGDVEEPSVLLKRLRRNSAQWYMGTVHYNPHEHVNRFSNRWRHHRRHHSRPYGGGHLADS